MILFTSHLMPGEVALHCSPRNSEIRVLFHRSQFDWPEHLLCPLLGYFIQPALNFLPTDRTLTGSSVSGVRRRAGDPAKPRGLDCRARRHLQDARHLYFTDYTLTGNKSLFAFGTGNHYGGELPFAAPSPNLFHQLHFDWWLGILPSASCPSRGQPAPPSPARSAPSFSYQSHFDWQPSFRLRGAIRQRPRRTPARGPITAFLASIGN